MTPDAHNGRLPAAFAEEGLTRRQFVQAALGLGVSVSGAAALLAGCSRTAGHGAKPAQLHGTVQVFSGFAANVGTQAAVQQALAEAFILIHPKVGIDFLSATSPAAARSQLSASIASRSVPDLVLPVGLAEVSRLVDRRAWLDLGPLLARDGLSLARFVPASVPGARLISFFGTKSSAVVGLPVGIHDHALACNADLFAKARVPLPPSGWSDPSWALNGSFVDTATAVTLDSSGRHPNDGAFNPSRITQFGIGRFPPEYAFYDFGGHFYDPSARRATLAEPGAVAGLQFAADLVNKYHVQPSATQLAVLGAAGGGKGDPVLAAWHSGKLAMLDVCSCEVKSVLGATTFSWQAAPLPVGPARRFGFGELDLGAIPAAGANRDLAWEVLKFFAVQPANERRLAYDGLVSMPALKDNQDAFVEGLKLDAPKIDPTLWTTGLASSSTENDEWCPAFADVHDLATATFARIVAGELNPTQAMPQLQAQSQAKIDAWFKTNKLP
ncbi:MAG: extracellular solute-binding protein [Actinomycetota bacterium]|nr:extracellular solute-binding protein [Actinomycetota bacterium]